MSAVALSELMWMPRCAMTFADGTFADCLQSVFEMSTVCSSKLFQFIGLELARQSNFGQVSHACLHFVAMQAQACKASHLTAG